MKLTKFECFLLGLFTSPVLFLLGIFYNENDYDTFFWAIGVALLGFAIWAVYYDLVKK